MTAVGTTTVVVALAGLTLAAGKSGSTEERLRRVVEELRETRDSLRGVMSDERYATRLLSDLDEGLFKARRELDVLERDVIEIERQVSRLRGEVTVDAESVEALRVRVSARLRALGRVGGFGHLRVLLAARNLHDLALRRALLSRVAARDVALLHALQDGKAELRADRQELELRAAALKDRRVLAAEALAIMEQTRQDRREALLALGTRRGTLEARLDALRGSQKKLRQTLWRLTATSRTPEGLAVDKGRLPWPVSDRVERDPDSSGGGDVAESSGWTLRAPLGAKVRSIAPGRVVHSGFLRGYGLLVIVDHGHSFHTLYAHLSRSAVAVGNEVAAGVLLGYVGDSESFDGPKLYFELRRGGRPVNPKRWLRPAPG